jgi:predicted PurR-regulated permease PerM
MTILSPRQQTVAFRFVVFALVAAAAITFLPLWAPLVLAAWVAVMARPLMLRVAKATGGRHRAAGALVVVLVMLIFVPIAASTVSLSRGAIELGQNLLRSHGAKSALISIVSGGGGDAPAGPAAAGADIGLLQSPAKIFALLQEHGAQAAQIVGGIAGAATEALLALFVFVYSVYVFLVDGPAMYDWLEKHAPLELEHTRRLVAAFVETGRGLFVGVGLTGLAQGVVATITYFALGVPRALVLGLLTCIASLIPSVGTALVWVPVAIGLALAGKTTAAIVMAAVGVLVIGTVDNVMRPVFARFGNLELSTYVLLTSIFGGLAIFGAWGFILGPLFARLAKEALIMARVDRLHDKRHEIDEAAATAAAQAAAAPPTK